MSDPRIELDAKLDPVRADYPGWVIWHSSQDEQDWMFHARRSELKEQELAMMTGQAPEPRCVCAWSIPGLRRELGFESDLDAGTLYAAVYGDD